MKVLQLIILISFFGVGNASSQDVKLSDNEGVIFENIPSDAVVALNASYKDIESNGINVNCYKFTISKDDKISEEGVVYRVGTGYIGEYWRHSAQDEKFFSMRCGPNFLYYVTGDGVIIRRHVRK